MIVHQPEVIPAGETVLLCAEVEMDQPRAGIPDRIWFRYPARYKEFLSDGGEAAAAALLLVASYFGEDMEVRAPVSSRFAYGSRQYLLLMTSYKPKLFKLIKLNFQAILDPEVFSQGEAVGSAFSGGVDSFYTLWRHLPQNQELVDARITHALFMYGFDTLPGDPSEGSDPAPPFQPLLRDLGLQLIVGSTNARQFSQLRYSWLIGHGAALYGAALGLAALFKRFYIPSTHHIHHVSPEGTSPLTDHLFSTDQMEFMHDGVGATRMEKIDRVSAWPVTYDQLFVCVRLRHGEFGNCGRCKKCVRTQAALSLVGDLEKYTTFRKGFGFGILLYWALFLDITPEMLRQLLRRALDLKRYDFVLLTGLVLLIGAPKKWLRQQLVSAMPRDLLFKMKRRIYPTALGPSDQTWSQEG